MTWMKFLLQDLPPIEDLKIDVDDNVVLSALGEVMSCVGVLGEYGFPSFMSLFHILHIYSIYFVPFFPSGGQVQSRTPCSE